MNPAKRIARLGELPGDRGDIPGAPVGPGGPGGVFTGSGYAGGGGAFQQLPSAPIANAAYSAFQIALAVWTVQTFLVTNNARRSLQIQNTGLGSLYVLFRSISLTPQSYAANTAALTQMAQSALWLVPGAAGAPGGSYEPFIPPTGAVSLISLGTATTGVVIEGV